MKNKHKKINWIKHCNLLYDMSISILNTSTFLMNQLTDDASNELIDISKKIEEAAEMYGKILTKDISSKSNIPNITSEEQLLFYRYEKWKNKISMLYHSLLHMNYQLIYHLLQNFNSNLFHPTFCLTDSFIILQKVVSDENGVVINITNTCPTYLKPVKSITLTRILEILAESRTEECANDLTTTLLFLYNELREEFYADNANNGNISGVKNEYQIREGNFDDESANTPDGTCIDDSHGSDNTSIIIYRTLTQYASPVKGSVKNNQRKTMDTISNSSSKCTELFCQLLMKQRLKLRLFMLALPFSKILCTNEIKMPKKNGGSKINKYAKHMIADMYEQILWEKTVICLEHVFLWWSNEAVGRKDQLFSQRFRVWLQQLPQTVEVPEVIIPVIQNLIDSLCCYITVTSWDQLFIQATILASYPHSRYTAYDVGLGTKTGQLFSDLLHDLVFLNNTCENYCYNNNNEQLHKLSLTEQIPILHRLDHSVHTVRTWAIAKAKYLTNSWNMDDFFRVTHTDVNASLYVLAQLKLERIVESLEESTNTNVTVCIKMRSKLVFEVNVNIEKLQGVSSDSIRVLASTCKIHSLKSLKLRFPNHKYWKQKREDTPQKPSRYVAEYLDHILKPVLLASKNLPLSVQKSVSKLLLEILCEAWLQYIYCNRVKFSESGALQLLIDFATVVDWLKDISINQNLFEHLSTDEILRTCEGVGKLLLREPGESIPMSISPIESITQGENLNDIKCLLEVKPTELMPAEMYVPNQLQWLQLRADVNKMANCCYKNNCNKYL